VPLFSEFDLQGGVLLLVDLILFEKRLQGGDLLVFFGDGGLDLGDELSLLADTCDFLLICLDLE
jgi:hypothetical protein